jgi:hypothetical protein
MLSHKEQLVELAISRRLVTAEERERRFRPLWDTDHQKWRRFTHGVRQFAGYNQEVIRGPNAK